MLVLSSREGGSGMCFPEIVRNGRVCAVKLAPETLMREPSKWVCPGAWCQERSRLISDILGRGQPAPALRPGVNVHLHPGH